jgi:hypothetical protein
MRKNSILVIIEIPEFEGLILTDKFSKFKIIGIETEKPIIRLDNYIFEGKWYYDSNSVFFFQKKETTFLNWNQKIRPLIFSKSKYIKKKMGFFFFDNFNENLNFFSNKRLRIFRIALLFCDN